MPYIHNIEIMTMYSRNKWKSEKYMEPNVTELVCYRDM